MKEKIVEIRNRLLNEEPLKHCEDMWAGAGLVIAKERTDEEITDVLVVTEHAEALSDLVFELMDACSDWLDFMNKREFFPALGVAANAYLDAANDREELLLHVINAAERLDFIYTHELYFAYGSNMDEAQMARRCPDAQLLEKVTVYDYRFALDAAGVATIVPCEGSKIEGLLWEISPNDLRSLDRYEGIAHGCYRRERIFVSAREFYGDAIVYISNRSLGPRTERSGYMERILKAAMDHNFSEAYVNELSGHLAPMNR